MKKVLVTLAPGFEEIETITVVDILRRAGARVFLAATQTGPVEGSRGVSVLPDGLLEGVNPDEYDLVVLPGGMPGTANLQKDPRVLDIIARMHDRKLPVAAICAAPTVLQTAGILKNKKVTSHPSVRDKLTDVDYSEDRVVVDGNVITSRGPGTAMEFALKLVEILFDKERVQTVNNGVLARI
jgi:4-methyl-5(b-hydroxyethyl)-thiazole monophosphate biosynthesis